MPVYKYRGVTEKDKLSVIELKWIVSKKLLIN